MSDDNDKRWDSTITEELLDRHLGDDMKDMYRLHGKLVDALRSSVRRDPAFAGLKCEADDIVQDVWLRVFQHGSLLRFKDQGRGSLRAYLGLILHRQLLDRCQESASIKRGGSHRILALHDGTGNAASGCPDAADDAETMVGLNDVLDACAGSLADRPEDLELWKLRVEGGWKFSEIAQRMKINEVTARRRLHTIRKALNDEGVLDFA